MKRLAIALALASLTSGGCATVVPLGAAIPATDTTPRDIPLEVVTRSSAPDPLPLAEGGLARYADLEASLGHAVSSAVTPWAMRQSGARRDATGGWQLVVELAQARAWRHEGVLSVALNARATLRTRAGHVYVAQTQAHCLANATVRADGGAPVFYVCMMTIGRELAGWLGGVEP
jgi:hypothetical protein